MAAKKDKVYWVLMERRLFTSTPIAVFATEKAARESEKHLIEVEGAKPSTLSVKRVSLLTAEEFAGVTWL